MSEGRLVRNSLFLVSIELFTKLLGLVLFVLMARILGAAEIGLYEGALALSSLFAILVSFGFDRRVEREVARDHALLYRFFWEINCVKILFSLLALPLLWLLLLVIGEPRTGTVMLIAVFMFTFSFINFSNSLFRGIGKPELELAVRGLFSILNLSLGVLALFIGWGLIGVVFMQLLSISSAMLLAFVIFQKTVEKSKISLGLRALWGHVAAAAPFVILMVILFLGNQVNLVLLSAMVPREEVGYFAAANRLFINIALIPAALMGAFLPVMSRLYKTSVRRFVLTLRFSMKYLFIISAPILVGTIIIAHPVIMLLYGEQFTRSVMALQILISAVVFSFWNHAGASLLIARNRERTLVWVFAAGAAVHIGSNLALIPFFSYLGASVAMVLTQGLQLFILLIFIRRYISTTRLLAYVAVPALCAVLMGAVVFLLLQISLLVAVLGGMAVYPLLLIISGSVKREDLHNLKRIMGGRPEARDEV